MLGISKDTYTDLATNETKEDVYVRLYVSMRKSGLAAQLKPTNFTVLMMICTYMDENGGCYPTQEQLAADCGISVVTVNKAINQLMKFEFNGKPIISREIVQNGYFKNSVYRVQPISQVAIFNGQVEAVENKTSTEVSTDVSTNTSIFKQAKDVGDYYTEVYKEVYTVQPNINFARDYSQVKKKWIGQFTDEQIKTMIETSVKEYDTRWKTPKFQRPTLSAIVSWIGEQALGLASNNEKDFKEVSEMTSDYVAINEGALNRLQNRLNK